MKIGYARVSTLDQNPDLQKDALEKAGCEKVIVDQVSGTVAQRPGLEKVKELLRDGDTLVVWRLDRLGRSLRDLIEWVRYLDEQGVGLQSLHEAIDTSTPTGKLTFHLFGALAEFERNLIQERTKAGLAAARARGHRGGRRKTDDLKEKGLGECINCTLCVQVCPTGIDIRDGLQYECIACAACIDVCDQVMDKMEYPRGLISFTTEHALQGEETHVLRPRMWIYGTLLLVIVSGIIWGMTHRVPLRAELIRDRNVLYRELPGGMIESVYMLKITNMDNKPHRYELTVLDNDIVEFDFSRPLDLQAEEVADFSMRIRMPASAGSGTQNLQLRFQAVDDPSIQRLAKARMLLPTQAKRAGQ